MALIGTLRNKMGKIVVGAIMVTMLSFILTDLIGNSTLLGGGNMPDLAEINGQSISNEEFQAKVNQISGNFALNTGRNPAQEELDQIRDQAWGALIFEKVYEAQFEELGILVSGLEQQDIVTGDNVSPFVQQLPFLVDPQTGVFSRDALNTFLANIRSGNTQYGEREFWNSLEYGTLIPGRKIDKYNSLLAKTNYVTKYEAKEEYLSQTSNASFEYVFVPFLSIPDSSVIISDKELEDFMAANQEEFKREESRNLEYVVFDVLPSPEDSAIVKREVEDLYLDIQEASNDSSFVMINSDDQFPFVTYQLENLPAQLKDGENARETGFVSEPAIVNGIYEFYKLSRVDEITSDSILYRVAKVTKEFFVSDETNNAVYREADLFAATVGNTEEFRSNAEGQGLRIQKANGIVSTSERVGIFNEGRRLALWAYNDAEKGAVSEVEDIEEKYVVATLVDIQDEGLANLDAVRNQVTNRVRNEKKTQIISDKLNGVSSNDLTEIAAEYGDEAQVGTVDVQLNSNFITNLGSGPEAVGLAFALNEEENTRAFQIGNGVVMIKLISKDLAEDLADYDAYKPLIAQGRIGNATILAEFPYMYFRVFVSEDVDNVMREFADIEDMRFRYF